MKIYCGRKTSSPKVVAYNPKTCKIGNQIWAAENLNIDDDGDGIYHHKGHVYYTWPAAVRVCSQLSGWHLPSFKEFETLFDAIGREDDGVALKSSSGWHGKGNGDNSLGFNALPVGYYSDDDADALCEGSCTGFWSATENGSRSVYVVTLYDDEKEAQYEDDHPKVFDGFSVRCVKG